MARMVTIYDGHPKVLHCSIESDSSLYAQHLSSMLPVPRPVLI